MGIFLKLAAVLGHTLCQQKEKRFVNIAAECRCLPLGLSPCYLNSVVEERKEERRGAKLILLALLTCAQYPRKTGKLLTVPVQLLPGVAT